MNEPKKECPLNRRAFLSRLAMIAAAGPLAFTSRAAANSETKPAKTGAAPEDSSDAEQFWGPHQGGITTPMQRHTSFAAFDLTTAKRADVAKLLRAWTEAAAR